MIPPQSRVFATKPGSKEPRDGTHGHLDAVPLERFDMSLVPRYANVGIALEGQYLVVDIDRPEAVSDAFAVLPRTWKQRTRRGWHLLYAYDGTGHNKKFPGGDVKCRGYIMGPGSVVEGFEYVWEGGEVAPAPESLRELVESGPDVVAVDGLEADGIPAGSHDEFLHRTASWVRGQYGLSEEALRRYLEKGPLAVLEGVNEDDPYTDTDLARLARSAASYEAGTAIVTTSLRCGSDVAAVPPKQEWILPGFIPAAQLTILYGDGKIGKSSFASWLAARESLQGRRVVFIASGEETFDLFVQRARLNGADDSFLYEYIDGGFNLLTGVPRLQAAIADLGGVSLVYIDALYSCFGPSTGENEAVRARRNLLDIAGMAARASVSVLGTIHENAQGGMLGSREMRNVCRSLLHATGGKGKPFTLWSAGTNTWSPDYGVSFPGREVPVLDETGQPQVFEDLYGDKVPQSIWVLRQGPRVASTPVSVVVDEVEEPAEDKVESALLMFPDISNKGIAELTGLAPSTVMHLAGPIRTKLGMTPDKGGRPPKK